MAADVATTGAALGYLTYRTLPLLAFSGPILPQGYVAASLMFVALTTPLQARVLFLALRRRWEVGILLAFLGRDTIIHSGRTKQSARRDSNP